MTLPNGDRMLIEARVHDDPNGPARLCVFVAVGDSKFTAIDAEVTEAPERNSSDRSNREHAYLMMSWLGAVLRHTVAAVREDCPE